MEAIITYLSEFIIKKDKESGLFNSSEAALTSFLPYHSELVKSIVIPKILSVLTPAILLEQPEVFNHGLHTMVKLSNDPNIYLGTIEFFNNLVSENLSLPSFTQKVLNSIFDCYTLQSHSKNTKVITLNYIFNSQYILGSYMG